MNKFIEHNLLKPTQKEIENLNNLMITRNLTHKENFMTRCLQ